MRDRQRDGAESGHGGGPGRAAVARRRRDRSPRRHSRLVTEGVRALAVEPGRAAKRPSGGKEEGAAKGVPGRAWPSRRTVPRKAASSCSRHARRSGSGQSSQSVGTSTTGRRPPTTTGEATHGCTASTTGRDTSRAARHSLRRRSDFQSHLHGLAQQPRHHQPTDRQPWTASPVRPPPTPPAKVRAADRHTSSGAGSSVDPGTGPAAGWTAVPVRRTDSGTTRDGRRWAASGRDDIARGGRAWDLTGEGSEIRRPASGQPSPRRPRDGGTWPCRARRDRQQQSSRQHCKTEQVPGRGPPRRPENEPSHQHRK